MKLIGHLLFVGFFESEGSDTNKQFQKLASAQSDDFRFAHTFNADVLSKYSYKEYVDFRTISYNAFPCFSYNCDPPWQR